MKSSDSGSKLQYRQRYFTLVEILAVVAIIGLLMGIGIGVYNVAMNSAKRAKTQTTIKKLEVTLEAFKVKYGYYPQVMDERVFYLDLTPAGVAVPTSPSDETQYFWKTIDYESMKSSSTRIDKTDSSNWRYYLVDGWGHPIYYRTPGMKNKSSFDIVSTGPDGRIGDNVVVGSGSTKLLYEFDSKNKPDLQANIKVDFSVDDPDMAKLVKLGEGDDLTNYN